MQQILQYFIVFFFTLFSIELAHTIPNIHSPNHSIRQNETDYEALLAFRSEIFDDPDSVLSSWNNSLHFCEWEGVTCGFSHKRVVRLRLRSTNLVGTLSPFIGNLSFLHTLHLYNNSFQGHIPHQISHLARLHVLVLAMNSFHGEIPANLSHCLHLTVLGLSNNNLVGRIPAELASLPNLQIFDVCINTLSGRLQDIGIGNMSNSLQNLCLSQNHLQGSIPDDIGRFKGLGTLSLGDNILSGTIPASLFNLSSLEILYLSHNKIQGHLPQDLGLRLPLLRYLTFSHNSLTGQVPTSLSNLSKLEDLIMSYNSFMGRFYLNGNNLPLLSMLNIGFGFSSGGEVRDLSFLDTLTNCTNLDTLLIAGNSFRGTFPRSILNLSTGLHWLDLDSNQISGQLPPGLGKFVNLYTLDLSCNHFTGPIPPDIGQMENIVYFSLSYNNFSGKFPSSIGNLTRLSLLFMEHNNLEGSLPKNLGSCQSLQKFYLSNNKFCGLLPVELLGATGLIDLRMGQNNLQGSLPIEISRLRNLFWLDVSYNRFSGEVPSSLGGCTSLTVLKMSGNSFVGSIPKSLSPLKSIQYLDLSCNGLSGPIPIYFSTWPYLLSLNLSFNNFEGEVPMRGVFANTSALSVVGNNKLCGGVLRLHLPRCPPQSGSKRRRLSLEVIMIISIACVLLVVSLVTLCLYFLCCTRKRKNTPSRLQNIKPLLEVSYQMLSRATNGFCPSNIVGVGGFGYVYKGILQQDDKETVVAVKVLNLQSEGANKSFMVECHALRNIRHRNLVRIITACSSIDTQHKDFKALVFEFMPRGSLESWLNSSNLVTKELAGDSQSYCLSLFQRLSIAIDIASALGYLHNGCATQIIHCDLKPSNILLDDEMTAHVGDFGLAKFLPRASALSTTNQTSTTQVRGTVGYAPPEYGIQSKVSPEGDMYSFGIIVLEMMTSKKPTDEMFDDGLNLHDFAKSALPDRMMDIIDHRMLGDANVLPARTGADVKKMECIKSLIMVGVQCSMELPQHRMGTADVVNELKSARQNFLCRST